MCSIGVIPFFSEQECKLTFNKECTHLNYDQTKLFVKVSLASVVFLQMCGRQIILSQPKWLNAGTFIVFYPLMIPKCQSLLGSRSHTSQLNQVTIVDQKLNEMFTVEQHLDTHWIRINFWGMSTSMCQTCYGALLTVLTKQRTHKPSHPCDVKEIVQQTRPPSSIFPVPLVHVSIVLGQGSAWVLWLHCMLLMQYL